MTRSAINAMVYTGIYKLPYPLLPAPLPNVASYSMAVDVSPKVNIASMPACVAPGKIAMSSGDEFSAAGGGGIISSKIKGESEALMPSCKVFMSGKGAIPHTSIISHNSKNAMNGTNAGPSQCKVSIG